MGSIYFADFVLMHRLLGISRMFSIIYNSKIEKRVEFNRPFLAVKTTIDEIGNVIPTLSRDLQISRTYLWLDYDGVLENGHLQDARLAATYLAAGSFLLITVDVEPPVDGKPADWRDYFRGRGRVLRWRVEGEGFRAVKSSAPKYSTCSRTQFKRALLVGRLGSSRSLAFSTKTDTRWLRSAESSAVILSGGKSAAAI